MRRCGYNYYHAPKTNLTLSYLKQTVHVLGFIKISAQAIFAEEKHSKAHTEGAHAQ